MYFLDVIFLEAITHALALCVTLLLRVVVTSDYITTPLPRLTGRFALQARQFHWTSLLHWRANLPVSRNHSAEKCFLIKALSRTSCRDHACVHFALRAPTFSSQNEPQTQEESVQTRSHWEHASNFWCLRPRAFPVVSLQLDELGSLVYSAFRPQIAPLVVFDERFFRAIILIEKPIDRVAWIYSAPDRRK